MKSYLQPAARRRCAGARFRNADNQDLWWWEKVPDGGDAPEVNGYWAGEIQEFVPTSGELLVLAEHWTDVAVHRTFTEWANAPFSVSTGHWRRVYFAWRRVYRIRALLGDVIDRVIEDQIKKFHDEDGGRWDPENWAEFLRLIDREAQKEHLGPVSSGLDPSSNVRLLSSLLV
jgi:hypothetical protein